MRGTGLKGVGVYLVTWFQLDKERRLRHPSYSAQQRVPVQFGCTVDRHAQAGSFRHAHGDLYRME